jgi:ribonuclease E
MKQDRARVKIGKISKFGLLELSRQRLRPSIDFGSMETCSRCGGKGQVPSAESLGLSFLRKLKAGHPESGCSAGDRPTAGAGSDLPA